MVSTVSTSSPNSTFQMSSGSMAGGCVCMLQLLGGFSILSCHHVSSSGMLVSNNAHDRVGPPSLGLGYRFRRPSRPSTTSLCSSRHSLPHRNVVSNDRAFLTSSGVSKAMNSHSDSTVVPSGNLAIRVNVFSTDFHTPACPGGSQSKTVLRVVSASWSAVLRTITARVFRMFLSLGFCPHARRTSSCTHVTDLPPPTGPAKTRTYLSPSMNSRCVSVGL